VSTVHLSGYLVCGTEAEAATVARHLPRHVALTRAEEGCVRFEVTRTEDPLVWRVEEQFRDDAAFRAHQQRARDSEWGVATAGIERRYTTHRAGAVADG